jgi:hypothetical protein
MFFGIRDPGSEIRDPGSGIRDKHPGSATLDLLLVCTIMANVLLFDLIGRENQSIVIGYTVYTITNVIYTVMCYADQYLCYVLC